jgi:glycine C-acetyltransferase
MADIFERLIKNYGPIGQHRERAHGYFAFPKLDGEIGSRMKFRGKEKIVWSLNNYLGLANHPEVRKADADAAATFGLALPMGARMMSGNSNNHEQLERELAAFEMKEDAILLNFGYQGIMSLIDALCSRHDVIVYDAESHACIIDGLRLHPGHRFVFKHNDVADCEKQLQRAQALIEKQNNGGILLITEGVFGMAGDQGKLKEIVELKSKYSFRLLVDDAHGFWAKQAQEQVKSKASRKTSIFIFRLLQNQWHRLEHSSQVQNRSSIISDTISEARFLQNHSLCHSWLAT